jgi:hypothetical protein
MKFNAKWAQLPAILVGVLCLLPALRGDQVPNPLTNGVCKGLTGDSCWNAVLNGFEGTQPCPVNRSCMVDVGIPSGNFVCASCNEFPQPSEGSGGQCSCEWSQIVNVLSYYGNCATRASWPQCYCVLSNPNYPMQNVAFICGGV